MSLSPCLAPEKARLISPLQLAYIGDSVHTLMTRARLMRVERRMSDMHRLATACVNAAAQARALARLLPFLTEEEAEMVRRGRNAHAHHTLPKAATAEEWVYLLRCRAMMRKSTDVDNNTAIAIRIKE